MRGLVLFFLRELTTHTNKLKKDKVYFDSSFRSFLKGWLQAEAAGRKVQWRKEPPLTAARKQKTTGGRSQGEDKLFRPDPSPDRKAAAAPG